MYETLRPDLLTASEAEKDLMREDPTYVVSWDIFSKNQLPYLEVRRPFILGLHDSAPIWKPTVYHYFTALLEDKHLLIRHYSQNIDGLDFKVQVPSTKLIPVHGSLSQVSCEGCGAAMDTKKFAQVRAPILLYLKLQRTLTSRLATLVAARQDEDKGHLRTRPECSANIVTNHLSEMLIALGEGEIVRGAKQRDASSNALFRSAPLLFRSPQPSTVLYGRNLPASFEENAAKDAKEAAVVIVAGTSLTVFPAASLPDLAPTASRVVVNRDYGAGMTSIDFMNNDRDIMLEGDCDSVFLDIIEELGWLDDLAVHRDDMCENSKALLDGRLKAVARATKKDR